MDLEVDVKMDKFLLEQEVNINDIEERSYLYDKSQKKATKKLIIASILCCIFMILEIVAGIVSNSLSLMTDASHLFCDLLSFGLNLFSIYVSNFEGNVDMSFGYHRAEIIGALFSIFFIWALSAYILYSAILRLFNVKVVNGYIMFITAFVSTIANIFIACILKVHTHGFGVINHQKCSHSKPHDHPNNNADTSEQKVQLSNEENDTVNNEIIKNNNSIDNKMNSISCNYVTFDYYENINKTYESFELSNSISKNVNKDFENISKKQTIKESFEPSQTHSNNQFENYNNNSNNKNNRNYLQVGINDCTNKKNCLNKKNTFNNKKICNNSLNEKNMDNVDPYINKDKNDEEIIDCYTYENNQVQNSHHDHNHEEINNISLRAAYIHAISDLIQNIGVMIASIIIWYNPKYSITDPICSIIFCFIVFSTTISVIKEIINILMEGTPVSINLIDLKNDLLKIPGVIDVHDLHVWSLSIGKPALACHIITHKNNSHIVLRRATLLCQYKYKILHTTVQTDYPSNVSNCETYAHLKCSNLKTIEHK